MWPQNYSPVAGSLGLSALVAAVPIFVLLILLGVLRKPAWISSLSGLAAAAIISIAVYGMPLRNLTGAITFGAAFGLFPIGWVVFTALLLYYLTLESGKFEIIKDSIGHLTEDRRLQAILIAFAFACFIEGAAGFGTPIAIAAAMLVGLGFSPFYAAALCLIADTAPVAFGSLGIPMVTLSATTGLPIDHLSMGTAWILAPPSAFLPCYLIYITGGWKALKGVLPAAVLAGFAFAGGELILLKLVGVQLTNILSALLTIAALLVLLKVWKPKDEFHFAEKHGTTAYVKPPLHSSRELVIAWSPYILLVIIILLWGYKPVATFLNSFTPTIRWPMLHNEVQRTAPIVAQPTPYAAVYSFPWLAAPGTACLVSTILAAFIMGIGPVQYMKVLGQTIRRLIPAEVTMASVLALAYLMNYAGLTGTLGLAFVATGVLFPFFSGWLGWLGVFLTGSDTSANALFGNLQAVTAGRLNLSPVLMAAGNSAGGVMGKMISLASIAVAASASSLRPEDEAKLFRFTIGHSLLMTFVVCLMVVFYCYIMPDLIR